MKEQDNNLIDDLHLLKMHWGEEENFYLAEQIIDEAIKALKEIQQYRAIGTPDELKQLKENGAFTGLELAQLAIMQMKLKEYQAIGTIEECRETREKQKAKKPENVKYSFYPYSTLLKSKYGECPVCKTVQVDDKYCANCGQKLDWGERKKQ